MDPNTLPTPNFGMSQPGAPSETQAINPNVVPETPRSPETSPGELPGGVVPVQQPTMPIPPPPTPAFDPAAMPGSLAPMASTVVLDESLAAEDNDLIEKEWVEKAKAIVQQTHDDPYRQNKEMTKVKAAYLKKRYNKDIKITEE